MKNKRLVSTAEAAMMAALSFILNFIIVFKMPQGGSVTAGAMIPIIIVALRRGYAWGVLSGVISGFLQFVSTGEAIHPVSILLDYIVAYGILGVAGFFKGSLPKVVTGTVLAVVCRFLSHLISGATIFASYAPQGQNPWTYSAIYNGTYMLPELVITVLFAALLYKYANRLFESVN
ncbi:MAG: energy-coupled thiamine transporter ThiT [Clostridia bacterium]|nr:energy-coupled thiamine transporter ThiT [Clostridia bacterium]